MIKILRRFAFLLYYLLIISSINIHAEESGLRLHLLDVGQGLSVLMQCDGHSLLYDGGGRESSSFVVSYLQKQKISRLDYVVASHFDEDHLNGIVGALHVFETDTVFSPDYAADTDIFRSFLSAAAESDAEMLHPGQGDTFDFGGALIQIAGPVDYNYPEENNNSICLRVTYGGTSVLVCGDAEAQAEEDMVNSGVPLESDVYIVSHHGSASSGSFYFLDHVAPEYALLSCGQDNSYAHPALETMERLQSIGCKLYRTDRQGTVILCSDGNSFSSDTEPCTDWSAGAASDLPGAVFDSVSVPSGTAPAAAGSTYVCNLNTKKFHYEFCDSVNKMKEKNKKYTNESREELISQGYDPCKNCNP